MRCGYCTALVVVEFIDRQPRATSMWKTFCTNPLCNAKGPWCYSREAAVNQHIAAFPNVKHDQPAVVRMTQQPDSGF